MGERYAGICRNRYGRCNARDNFKIDAMLNEIFRFFCPSSKYEGVSTFETDNDIIVSCFLDEESVNVRLWQ